MKLHRHRDIFTSRLPKLVADLVDGVPEVLSFVRAEPSLDAVLRYADERSFNPHHRAVLTEVCSEQNRTSLHDAVHASLIDLTKPTTLTVTTGHQLNVLGGPAYFVYKIAHTVALARALELQRKDLRVVPVFWMASEDHDFAEIATVRNFNHTYSLRQENGGAVGPLPAANLKELVAQFIEGVPGMDTSTADFLNNLGQSRTLSDATRTLVDHLFGQYGVVVLDASDRRLKSLFVPTMREELRMGKAFNAISTTNQALIEAGYSLQLNAREVNLFYLSEGSRDGILKDGERFRAGTVLETDEQGILDLLESSPERFSPNAALRPVYQECILPNLAYIGGPGEMSYWMQLKRAFDAFGIDYPVLIPRNSVTIIGSKESEWMVGFGLTEMDLLHPLHELTRRMVLGDEQRDSIIAAARLSLEAVFQQLAEYMKAIDPTLEGKVAASGARTAKELDGLEKSIIKAKKQHEEVSVRRLERIHQQAFPDGPQERSINFFALQALAQDGLVERLVRDFRPDRGEWLVYFNQ